MLGILSLAVCTWPFPGLPESTFLMHGYPLDISVHPGLGESSRRCFSWHILFDGVVDVVDDSFPQLINRVGHWVL